MWGIRRPIDSVGKSVGAGRERLWVGGRGCWETNAKEGACGSVVAQAQGGNRRHSVP